MTPLPAAATAAAAAATAGGGGSTKKVLSHDVCLGDFVHVVPSNKVGPAFVAKIMEVRGARVRLQWMYRETDMDYNFSDDEKPARNELFLSSHSDWNAFPECIKNRVQILFREGKGKSFIYTMGKGKSERYHYVCSREFDPDSCAVRPLSPETLTMLKADSSRVVVMRPDVEFEPNQKRQKISPKPEDVVVLVTDEASDEECESVVAAAEDKKRAKAEHKARLAAEEERLRLEEVEKAAREREERKAQRRALKKAALKAEKERDEQETKEREEKEVKERGEQEIKEREEKEIKEREEKEVKEREEREAKEKQERKAKKKAKKKAAVAAAAAAAASVDVAEQERQEQEARAVAIALNAENEHAVALKAAQKREKEKAQELAAARKAGEEARKLTAALKAKQDEEQRLASVLKAKQDEEQRLASVLKAKQEEEQRLALVLKAKQEEEHKQAAALKAKVEERLAAALSAKEEEQRQAAARAVKEQAQRLAAALKLQEEALKLAEKEVRMLEKEEARKSAAARKAEEREQKLADKRKVEEEMRNMAAAHKAVEEVRRSAPLRKAAEDARKSPAAPATTAAPAAPPQPSPSPRTGAPPSPAKPKRRTMRGCVITPSLSQSQSTSDDEGGRYSIGLDYQCPIPAYLDKRGSARAVAMDDNTIYRFPAHVPLPPTTSATRPISIGAVVSIMITNPNASLPRDRRRLAWYRIVDENSTHVQCIPYQVPANSSSIASFADEREWFPRGQIMDESKEERLYQAATLRDGTFSTSLLFAPVSGFHIPTRSEALQAATSSRATALAENLELRFLTFGSLISNPQFFYAPKMRRSSTFCTRCESTSVKAVVYCNMYHESCRTALCSKCWRLRSHTGKIVGRDLEREDCSEFERATYSNWFCSTCCAIPHDAFVALVRNAKEEEEKMVRLCSSNGAATAAAAVDLSSPAVTALLKRVQAREISAEEAMVELRVLLSEQVRAQGAV